MKTYFSRKSLPTDEIEEDFTSISLRDSIEKTRQALEIAYTGFDYAIDADIIDSYIYEINSLQKRYKHLCELISAETVTEPELRQNTPIRALVSHVLG